MIQIIDLQQTHLPCCELVLVTARGPIERTVDFLEITSRQNLLVSLCNWISLGAFSRALYWLCHLITNIARAITIFSYTVNSVSRSGPAFHLSLSPCAPFTDLVLSVCNLLGTLTVIVC